jgi:hypothetical protein
MRNDNSLSPFKPSIPNSSDHALVLSPARHVDETVFTTNESRELMRGLNSDFSSIESLQNLMNSTVSIFEGVDESDDHNTSREKLPGTHKTGFAAKL